jgi:hypothetical protein
MDIFGDGRIGKIGRGLLVTVCRKLRRPVISDRKKESTQLIYFKQKCPAKPGHSFDLRRGWDYLRFAPVIPRGEA